MRVIVAWIACGKNVQDPGDVSRSEATVPGKQADGSRAPQQSRQNCRFKFRSPQKLPNGILQREAPRILGGTFGNKSRTPRKTVQEALGHAGCNVFLVQSEVHPPRRRDGPLVDGLLRQIGFVCHVPSGADPRLYSVCVCAVVSC